MDANERLVAEIVAKRKAGKGATDATPIKEPKVRFLEAYMEDGTISMAARAAGIDRATFYRWKDADPDFAQAFIEAEEAAIESLEYEARRRARARSDTLLIFLLKSKRPDVYADRVKNEVTGANGGPIKHECSLEDTVRRYADAIRSGSVSPLDAPCEGTD